MLHLNQSLKTEYYWPKGGEKMGWKILVIEDNATTLKVMKDLVFERDPRFTPVFVSSIEEAEKAFSAHVDIAGISVDGCVESEKPPVFGEPNTLDLVKKFKETFKGPIVAASSGFNSDLLAAGCTHQVESKYDICKKCFEILSTSPVSLGAGHGKTAL